MEDRTDLNLIFAAADLVGPDGDVSEYVSEYVRGMTELIINTSSGRIPTENKEAIMDLIVEAGKW